ncbi:MAG: LemA family protein [Burkholderiaceae bacterium]|nr:LemA family protein [Burkholderiaceae bacterium]
MTRPAHPGVGRATQQERHLAWIVVLIVLALVGYAIVLYNRLVRARQMAAEGWSGIDVQLKRRADLVPNLVETVQGYATHERELLQRVTELRNQARAVAPDDVAARAQAEGLLGGALGRLLAVVENYPDLKANQNFLQLQEQLAMIENEIQMARRYYNGATRDLNVLVESFPSNLVAGWTGFARRAFFETDEASRAVPQVSFPR